MSQLLTHRGFTISQGDKHGYLDLPLIDTLYHHMETNNHFAGDFGFVQDVLKAAKQILFDRNGQFLLARQLNIPCSHWVFNFTVSTLAFISGVPRKLSLENYRDLMLFHPQDIVAADSKAVVRQQDLGWVFSADASVILSRWLQQEDGLTDLLMSLNLIGGSLPAGWYHQTEGRPPS
ncbi:hypothetical protein D3C76_670990 [compost metagenome]